VGNLDSISGRIAGSQRVVGVRKAMIVVDVSMEKDTLARRKLEGGTVRV